MNNQSKKTNHTDKIWRAWVFGKNTDENKQVSQILEKAGYHTISIHTLEYLEELINNIEPDALLLCSDVISTFGIQLVNTLRMNGKKFCIISIGRREHLNQCIESIEAGANDFLRAPMSTIELLSRVKRSIITSSVNKAHATEEHIDGYSSFRIGKIKINAEQMSISTRDRREPLTKGELELLNTMYKLRGEVATRERIIEKLGGHYNKKSRSLDVRISKIKKKFTKLDPYSQYIETYRGIGYQLVGC